MALIAQEKDHGSRSDLEGVRNVSSQDLSPPCEGAGLGAHLATRQAAVMVGQPRRGAISPAQGAYGMCEVLE